MFLPQHNTTGRRKQTYILILGSTRSRRFVNFQNPVLYARILLFKEITFVGIFPFDPKRVLNFSRTTKKNKWLGWALLKLIL